MPSNHLDCSRNFRVEYPCLKGKKMPERTDKERFDWLQSKRDSWLSVGATIKQDQDGETWWFMDWFGIKEGEFRGADIREVIDAAMDEEASDAK